jgi:hypothetical protein
MGARRSKRHHSVPQEHLRRFTGEDGLLYQYQRGDGTVRRVSPTNAAVESYLYAPGDGPDPRADDVEAFLSEKIEGPAIPALRKLADGDPELSDEERHRVALYIAFQEQRVPAMRDRILDFAKEIAMDLMRTAPYREDFESMCREIGEDPDEVRRGQKLLEEGGMTLEMSNRLWLSIFLDVSVKLASLIVSMRWLIADAPTGFEFVTSDRPVVKVLTDRTVPSTYAGGWLSPSAEATFTLRPERTLVITAEGHQGRAKLPLEWCEDVNRRTIRSCHRFVFSRSEHPSIASTVADLSPREAQR